MPGEKKQVTNQVIKVDKRLWEVFKATGILCGKNIRGALEDALNDYVKKNKGIVG